MTRKTALANGGGARLKNQQIKENGKGNDSDLLGKCIRRSFYNVTWGISAL